MNKDNTKTRYAREKILSVDSDIGAGDYEELFDSTKYAMELDKRKCVLEGVQKYLPRLEPEIDINNEKEIRRVLKKRYENMGISDKLPEPVRHWLKGVHPGEANRENLYNLCLVL